MYIGIDIIDIDRVKLAVERTPRFLNRVYTPGEVTYCYGKKNPYPSLAARFAAKEAVRKLHPVFAKGIRFQDVEVFIHPDGRPQILLHGEAKRQAQLEGFKDLSLSLSHSRNQAIAAIIAIKR
ncbi:holo-ACP synthase [Syntrophomonas erecta]